MEKRSRGMGVEERKERSRRERKEREKWRGVEERGKKREQ